MCSICKSEPCVSGCPNAPIAYSGLRCARCKAKIRAGEDYLEGYDDAICESCADNMTSWDVFEFFGYRRTWAMEREVFDYDGNYDDD